MKTVKAVHNAVSAPIDDLVTFRALPTGRLPMERLNPFIFLNHHGPQFFPPDNNGMPFGPHPHRGMETVTFIIDGDIVHKDSGGYNSTITAGGIQWMTAGRGLIHAEVSSEEFKRNGGQLEILQLWLNLPAADKMVEPVYKGLQKNDIPAVKISEGIVMNLISGEWDNLTGPFNSLTGIFLSTIEMAKGSRFETDIPEGKVVFLYVVRGKINVNETNARIFNLVEFSEEGNTVKIEAAEESILIFGYANPLNEPIIAQGPFVMNSFEEIEQAYSDYKAGKFGRWE